LIQIWRVKESIMTEDGELSEEEERLARVVAEYHRMGHELEKADVVLVLGSNDFRVAECGAAVYGAGMAGRVLCTGRVGALTEGLYRGEGGEMISEAEAFGRVCVEKGVPEGVLLLEGRATNTGENAVFSRELLERNGLLREVKRAVVVQKPYMERRAWATFRKVWPELEIRVTSPGLDFLEYGVAGVEGRGGCSLRRVVEIMVGDLQRIRIYPGLGFQIEQEIPGEVWEAYEALVALGFDGHLVK
jgi:uncharacterized SAM-binding protein YcdF (DUF218 family)